MPNQGAEGPEMLVDSILHQHPRIDQDLFQMDAQLWAVHGFIPVDGEVILAEFDQHETARAFLAQLAAAQELEGRRSESLKGESGRPFGP